MSGCQRTLLSEDAILLPVPPTPPDLWPHCAGIVYCGHRVPSVWAAALIGGLRPQRRRRRPSSPRRYRWAAGRGCGRQLPLPAVDHCRLFVFDQVQHPPFDAAPCSGGLPTHLGGGRSRRRRRRADKRPRPTATLSSASPGTGAELVHVMRIRGNPKDRPRSPAPTPLLCILLLSPGLGFVSWATNAGRSSLFLPSCLYSTAFGNKQKELGWGAPPDGDGRGPHGRPPPCSFAGCAMRNPSWR